MFEKSKRTAGSPRRAYSAGEIAAALEAFAEASGVNPTPLVIVCMRVGDDGEDRAPGLYYTDPEKRVGPEIVFTGLEPPEELLNKFKPKPGGHRPLIITLGPSDIPPPPDQPQS